MVQLKKFFKTSVKTENLNKFISIFLIALSLLGILNFLIYHFFIIKFLKSYPFPNFSPAFIDILLQILKKIMLNSLIFSIVGLIAGSLLLLKNKLGYFLFLLFNSAFVLYAWYLKQMILDIYYQFIKTIFAPYGNTFSINTFYNQVKIFVYIGVLVIVIVHLWVLWRYLQRDMKYLFQQNL